jgi:hypothetical protein
MKLRVSIPVLATILVLAGCGLPAPGSGPSSRDVITQEDIEKSSAYTAYELVERLQPHWLTSRGNVSITDDSATIPSVFLGGVQVGNVEYLRGVLVQDVAELRFYAPGEAAARFGMGHQRGVIVLTLKG